jgi:hypothetical protein
MNVGSKYSETLPDDRSGTYKHLREVSRSYLASSLLDMRNTESQVVPFLLKSSQPVVDDRDVITSPRSPQIDE